jgi:septal ring-binding cell division protein DamX
VKGFLGGFLLAAAMTALGQDADVQRYVTMVEEGRVEEVRQAVPSLLDKYPNNPGVLYVQALVAKVGAEAARIYQSIVDNFPRTTYADAALYRVYQFYYSLGLYRTAELKLAQLKREYPGSRFLKKSAQESAALAEEVDSARTPPPVSVPPALPAGEATPAARPPEATPVAPTAFALQVGAYGALENAEKQRKFFVERGYAVEMITKVRDTRTFHVVLVGRYATYEEAKAAGTEMKKKHNITFMVIPR